MTLIQTAEMLEEAVDEHASVVLYSSDLCLECDVARRYIQTLEKMYPRIEFYEVKRGRVNDFERAYGLQSAPHLFFFAQGDCIGELVWDERPDFLEVKNRLEEAFAKGDKGCS